MAAPHGDERFARSGGLLAEGCEHARARDRIPTKARSILLSVLPASKQKPRITARTAGIGSLGRPRYLATIRWSGGWIAREIKAAAPSALSWLTRRHGPLRYRGFSDRCRALSRSVRRDPRIVDREAAGARLLAHRARHAAASLRRIPRSCTRWVGDRQRPPGKRDRPRSPRAPSEAEPQMAPLSGGSDAGRAA